jgi:hypothetical protein
MKKIKLKKEFVLRLYYFTWQAWRSLHVALGAPWHEFREFYSPDRTQTLRELIGALRSLVGPRRRSFQFQDSEAVCVRGDWWTRLFYAGGGLPLDRWKSRFAFWEDQLDYFASQLESFLEVLVLSEKPGELDELITLRMMLCNCCWMIEQRWRVDRFVRFGEQIEHLGRSGWIRQLSLQDLWERAGLSTNRIPAMQGT